MMHSQMTKEEDKAYDLGWDDGFYNALYCCFKKPRPFREFDTPEEQQAYIDGRENGYNSVDN